VVQNILNIIKVYLSYSFHLHFQGINEYKNKLKVFFQEFEQLLYLVETSRLTVKHTTEN